MSVLPEGTVTFLFTDLERSTRLWEEHPEAMKDALARHDAILQRAVLEHDGHIVKSTGDGVHAAFATAPHAVNAAVAGQLALQAESGARRDRCACAWVCTPAIRSTGVATTTARW